MRAQTRMEQNGINRLWWIVFWVSFPFGVLGFLLPIYGKYLGASALEIGGFFTAMSLVPALIRPVLGRALDRFGRRPFLFLGLFGYLLATLVFSFADSVYLLLIARVFQGVGSAFLWISAYTMIADLARETRRVQEFGSVDEASYRGGLIGTIIGFSLVMGFEQITGFSFERIWFWLFLLYLIPVGIAMYLGLTGTRETISREIISQENRTKLSKHLLALMGIVLITGASQTMVWPLLMIFLQDRLGARIGILAIA